MCALLSQIPLATLSDMASAKNGLTLVVLVALAGAHAAPLVPSLVVALRLVRPPTEKSFLCRTTGPWWLVAFVCVLYSHALLWLVSVAAGLMVTLYQQLAIDPTERSAVLRLLGFSTGAEGAPAATNQTLSARNMMILAALLIALGSQTYLVLRPSSTIPTALYVLPLYLLGMNLALAGGYRLRGPYRAVAP